MPSEIIPVTGLSETGLIADLPPVILPINSFTDCNNVRFRHGAVSKVNGMADIMPYIRLGSRDILKYVAWWPNPNLARFNMGYYMLIVEQDARDQVYVIKVDELGDVENPVYLTTDNTLIFRSPTTNGFEPGGNWQHTFFQGGFALIINNGLTTPHFILDTLDNTSLVGLFAPLEGWDSYAVPTPTQADSTATTTVNSVTASVIRSFGDFLIAGDLVERDSNNDIVRALPGVIRTSDIAAPGMVPTNWNPFSTAVNTADEFTLTADGVVQDLVELQGKMFAYSNSSISAISRTGNPTAPFSVATVTPSYGALTTDAVIEFDGRHFVVGAQDIYIFGGHPGSIQSVGEGRVRDYFYDDLNLVALDQLFLLRYLQKDEIWVCYPSQEAVQGRSDKALVYNYRLNVWSKRDLPGVFNGVVGPVPGGGLPMASLGFDGAAQVSTITPGVTHEVQISDLTDVAMQGTGRTYIERLDLSGIDPIAPPVGNPSIRVTLGEDFYTGREDPLRVIIRAIDPADSDNFFSEIYTLLPSDLGISDLDPVEYDSTEFRNEVLNPIITALRREQAAINGEITIQSVTDDGFANRSFDVTFDLDVIGQTNIVPNVSIVEAINTTREYNFLRPEDRPQSGGSQDTTVDRIGHNIGIDEDPDLSPLLQNNNTVFMFDFTDIWDRLDDFVFFFKGERTGFIDFNNRFEDLSDDIKTIIAGILVSDETEDVRDGDSGPPMDGGSITDSSVVADGDAVENSDFSPGTGVELTNNMITGARIRELIQQSAVTNNRRLDFLVDLADVTDLNMIAYMIPSVSDGVSDYAYERTNSGLLHLNFWNARFDKVSNEWVRDTRLEPISAILAYQTDSMVVQNELFAESIAATLNETSLFTASRVNEAVQIVSVNNGAYILEWEIENLVYTDSANTPVPNSDIVSDASIFRQGIPDFRNTAGTLVAPCIRVVNEDPDGIDFFSFDTGFIDLRGQGNSMLTVAQQLDIIDNRIQALRPGQWRRVNDTWMTTAVFYNQADGDTGVAFPEADGTYSFPAERNGTNWTVQYHEWTQPITLPSASISQQGRYEAITPGSYFAMLMSDNTVYSMPVTGTDIAMSLSQEIRSRLPQLDVILTGGDGGLSIQPGTLGANTLFVVEAYFNSTDTISDFNRLVDPNNFTQDPLNATFATSLPTDVTTDDETTFPSVDDGPVVVNSTITTEFDTDRTWSADQVDFSYEFPIFAGGHGFANGTTANVVTAAEIGWSFPSYSLAGTRFTGFESFVERRQMALSPEFNTEHLFSIALWADGSTPIQFQGDNRYNVLELNISTTNNPGQEANLSEPNNRNTFYISEDYKMDMRLTGRFFNWKLSDSITEPLITPLPGNKTFSQQTEWNFSGMQMSIRTSGSR